MYGGRDTCPRCSKAVYAAEMVIGPERKGYHKTCLTCASCKTRLALGAFQEHDGEPYCRNCHRRLFATQDLRSANLPSADNSFSQDTEDDATAPVLPATEVPLAVESGEAVQLPASVKNQPSSPNAKAAIRSPASPAGSPAGPRRSFGGPRVECPRCQKAVYQAEQVLAVGKKWHRGCLLCTACNKRLDTHNLSDKDGEPFCRACYSKNHGPAGGGYALLGKAGG